jgi:hypothetical protein
MVGIEWLSRGLSVCKEISVLTDEADVIARALDVATRHPDQEPDSFRLTDATGAIVAAFPIVVRKNDDRR